MAIDSRRRIVQLQGEVEASEKLQDHHHPTSEQGRSAQAVDGSRTRLPPNREPIRRDRLLGVAERQITSRLFEPWISKARPPEVRLVPKLPIIR